MDVIQKWLGHSKLSTTMEIYAYTTDDRADKYAESMPDSFREIFKPLKDEQ